MCAKCTDLLLYGVAFDDLEFDDSFGFWILTFGFGSRLAALGKYKSPEYEILFIFDSDNPHKIIFTSVSDNEQGQKSLRKFCEINGWSLITVDDLQNIIPENLPTSPHKNL